MRIELGEMSDIVLLSNNSIIWASRQFVLSSKLMWANQLEFGL